MSETPTAPAFAEEVMLLAEKLGELNDRLAKAEADLATQTAPLDATKAAQDATLAALSAALSGIKALNFHVLGNDLGAVSKRVEVVAERADTAIKALSAQIVESQSAILSAKGSFAQQLAQTDAQRMELARKRDEDAQAFAAKFGELQLEINHARATLAGELRAAIKQFATPPGLNPRGEWDAQATYARLDVVTLNGTSYVSQVDGNSDKPGKASKSWQVLARRGSGSGSGSSFEPASLQPLAAGATITWDLLNPIATVTLGAAANAFTLNNARAGGTYVLILKQDGSGSRTVTWPANVNWPGDVAPTLTTTANRADVCYLVYDGAVFYGSLAQNYVTS